MWVELLKFLQEQDGRPCSFTDIHEALEFDAKQLHKALWILEQNGQLVVTATDTPMYYLVYTSPTFILVDCDTMPKCFELACTVAKRCVQTFGFGSWEYNNFLPVEQMKSCSFTRGGRNQKSSVHTMMTMKATLLAYGNLHKPNITFYLLSKSNTVKTLAAELTKQFDVNVTLVTKSKNEFRKKNNA
jgi:hypothetical protein